MGLYGGPPQELMLALREEFAIERFLETGTHRGGTAAWAAEHFAEVVTIEASEELHGEAVARNGHLGNVRFVLGDTRDVLPAEVERLGGPAIVWLDSHWCGGETFGESAECPLLFEIQTLRESAHEHHLFVDDARLFLAPPPRPHRMDDWPTLSQVVGALADGERPLEVVVLDDAFVAVPARARSLVRRRAQDATTLAWEQRRTSVAEPRRLSPALRRLGVRAQALAARVSRRDAYPPAP